MLLACTSLCAVHKCFMVHITVLRPAINPIVYFTLSYNALKHGMFCDLGAVAVPSAVLGIIVLGVIMKRYKVGQMGKFA